MVLELTFQRASVHPVHDAKRLEEGKDLNDALLDFFVKLGQALIPENSGGSPPVAYLGAHFYDMLRKGGMKDGRAGHKNVANWAKRRLGKNSFFTDGIGALAVPINEVLWNTSYEGRTETQEKHWWLALILNPQAAGCRSGQDDEDTSLLCLDSFVRAEASFDPPVRALRGNGHGGSLESHPAEVRGLSRVGFDVKVFFRSHGDGTYGALPEPRNSRLKAGGREFDNTDLELKSRERGGHGKFGRLEGSLGFRLDRRGAAKTCGEYTLMYGDANDDYQPELRLRMGEKPTSFQAEVGRFLGGYLAKEREIAFGTKAPDGDAQMYGSTSRIQEAVCLPGVPQQETSHDCGFFILEMILRALQLTPEALRELATASSVEIAMLPWPSQKQVFRRKARLRDALNALLTSGRQRGTGDVEAILKAEPELRAKTRAALIEGGSSFSDGFERWAAGDWDLSPSPSRSNSRSKNRKESEGRARSAPEGTSRSRSRKKKKKKKGRRRSSTSSESNRRKRKGSDSRSESGANNGNKREKKDKKNRVPEVLRPSFTAAELEACTASKLRALCVEHGVLPVGAVEKGDLLQALIPLASPEPRAPSVATPPPAQTKPTVSKPFTRAELDAMSTKELRILCIQRRVLPAAAVERSDFVQALVPLAVAS